MQRTIEVISVLTLSGSFGAKNGFCRHLFQLCPGYLQLYCCAYPFDGMTWQHAAASMGAAFHDEGVRARY